MTDLQERPKLKLKITPFELTFNVITLILFTASVIYLIIAWGALPSEVPGHYNAAGAVDRWGSKWELLILPVIAFIMWIGMTILERYPHVYNYMNLTKDNVKAQYLNARLMLNVLKNIMTLIFAYLTWKDIQVALYSHDGLGVWFTPIFFLLTFGPMIYFIIRSFRLKK